MKGIERQGKGTDGSAGPAVQGNGLDVPGGEATIDQVRNLLFGGAQRSIESNLDALRQESQAALAQARADFANELAAVRAELAQLERATEQKRLASLKDIGTAITQLGAAISGLGSDRTGK